MKELPWTEPGRIVLDEKSVSALDAELDVAGTLKLTGARIDRRPAPFLHGITGSLLH